MTAVIVGAILVALIFTLGGLLSNVCAPVVNFVVTLAVEPLSIPFVSQLIVWGQGAAMVVVIIICIVKGVYEGALARGKENPGGVTEWIFRTVLNIAGVALMPVFCNMVVSLGSTMFADVQGAVVTSSAILTPTMPDQDFLDALLTDPIETLAVRLGACFMIIVVVFACVKTAYELIKRQMTLLAICAIAPWVSIKVALDSKDEYLDLITSLLGLCLTQWLQYAFLLIAVSMFNGLLVTAGTTGNWFELNFFNETGLYATMMVLGAFGCAMGIPALIERYAFSSGRQGAGGMVVGMALRGGARGVGKLPSAITAALKTAK